MKKDDSKLAADGGALAVGADAAAAGGGVPAVGGDLSAGKGEGKKARGKGTALEKSLLSELAGKAGTVAKVERPGAKGGRPTLFTQELADEFCERIALGEAVRQVCLLPGMPDETTFYRWLLKNDDFRAQYRNAKEAQMDRMEESLIEIADESRNDWVERENDRGEKKIVLNDECVNRTKVRIATRQWLMAKLKPKKYGDKVELTGEGGKTEVTVNMISQERLEELQRRRREAMEGGSN